MNTIAIEIKKPDANASGFFVYVTFSFTVQSQSCG